MWLHGGALGHICTTAVHEQSTLRLMSLILSEQEARRLPRELVRDSFRLVSRSGLASNTPHHRGQCELADELWLS